PRGLACAAPESSRKVTIVAVAAYRIRIQDHQFSRPYPPSTCLAEPGICSLARGQEPGLDEFASLTDNLVVHDCEEFIFTDTRSYGVADGCNCRFGSSHARLQAFDLFRCFDRPDTKDFALAVPDLKPTSV